MDPSPPLRIAAIDVGTNAIRFIAAESGGTSGYRTVAEARIPVRIGHGVYSTGRISADACTAALEGLSRISVQMKDLGVRSYRAVATSAVRDSRNRREFLRRVREKTGIRLEVVSGPEEARLVHAAVGSRMSLGEDTWICVELGGGSVEVYLADARSVKWCETHAMGAVRLLELFSRSGEESRDFAALLTEYVATIRLPESVLSRKPRGLIATGGNIESLARIAGARPDAKGVSRFPRSALRSIIGDLAGLSVRERASSYELRGDRADVILPAAVVYGHFADLVQAEEIIVPAAGVREGILLDLSRSVPAGEDTWEERIIEDTVALGRKYNFEEPHALSVARLSISLFDQLAALHSMGARERRLLLAAAILHDIGNFVSYKGHHKHSLYLISQSELPGFTPTEMFVIANISRYHRKGYPSIRHEGYSRLSPQDRDRVLKLSALLRIADALDREHRGKIDRIEARMKDSQLEIRADSRGDVLLEHWAMRKKASLFHEVYRARVSFVTEGRKA